MDAALREIDHPSKRNGFFPAAFTPKQNPFYVALPFAEVDEDGKLKEMARKIPGFGKDSELLTREPLDRDPLQRQVLLR